MNEQPSEYWEIQIDPHRFHFEQLSAPLSAIPPQPCRRHRGETVLVDVAETIDQFYCCPPYPESVSVRLIYFLCVRCKLEGLGLNPKESACAFENFMIEPPQILARVEACRRFASHPDGALILAGSTGTGKTHLAIAILRERFLHGRRGEFVKGRKLCDLGGEPAWKRNDDSSEYAQIVKEFQLTPLLVIDDLEPVGGRGAVEALFLDLIEYRIGRDLPMLITTNILKSDLEVALGSRALDRLRGFRATVLSFGFPSKRTGLNPAVGFAKCDARRD